MEINLCIIAGFIVVIFFATSCKPSQNIPYFQDFADNAKPIVVKTAPFKSPVIQIDDILNNKNVVSSPYFYME